MARAALLLLLLATACRSRVPAARESDVYAGVGAAAVPGYGLALTGGQRFAGSEKFDFDFEMTGTIGKVTDADPGGNEDFFQIQAGVRQSLSPGHPRRLVFRYGATWMRATSSSGLIGESGDWFGAYGGIGYDIDLGPRWVLSPQLNVLALGGEGDLGFEILPQALLQLLFRF